MLRHISDSLRESPVKSGILLIAVWAVLFNILFAAGEYVFDNFIFQGISFMILYPAASFFMFYKYGKNFGHRWYTYVVVFVILLVEFIIFGGVRAIIPNIIVMTLLCMLFGGGLGGCFFDKTLLPEKTRKKDRQQENYKNILDD